MISGCAVGATDNEEVGGGAGVTHSPRLCSSSTHLRRFFLDELDLVTVWILHEGDYGGAMFHRSHFACDFAAALFHFLASPVGVVHFDGDMAIWP